MIIFRTISAIQNHLTKLRISNKTIGFVPTMGALHAGHLSLVQQSQHACDVSVVSIFVNPAQFNDPKDFEKYPVTTDADCLQLEQQHTDILFLPDVKEMYPAGVQVKQHFDLGFLEEILEGKHRPGHYQGVCQAVSRLLEVVQPQQLFLGQKDYQQCKVVQRLIYLMGADIQLNIAPTMRETDGLAMSSRNTRLNAEQRQQASAIYRQLQMIKESAEKQNAAQLMEQATFALKKAGFSSVDYVAIADAGDLHPLSAISPNEKVIVLIAAYLGNIRLIDNLILN